MDDSDYEEEDEENEEMDNLNEAFDSMDTKNCHKLYFCYSLQILQGLEDSSPCLLWDQASLVAFVYWLNCVAVPCHQLNWII